MKSRKRGPNTSPVEIAITKFGLWLYINHEEFFLSYDQYPFFYKATICDIYNVELLHGVHLHWPDLDADLSLDILRNPDAFPLIDSAPVKKRNRIQRSRKTVKKPL